MTPQESQTLRDFLGKLIQVARVQKDPHADELIKNALVLQPDAAYLLVQRALLLDQALTRANAQIEQLQRTKKTAGSNDDEADSFLDQSQPWGNSAGSTSANAAAAITYTRPEPPSSPQNAAAATTASPGWFGGAGNSVFGTIAATAAGVAGGAFLFHGIENLLEHHTSDSADHTKLADLPTDSALANNFFGADNANTDLASDALIDLDAASTDSELADSSSDESSSDDSDSSNDDLASA